MKRPFKILLIILGVLLAIFFGLFLIISIAVNDMFPESIYDKQDLIDNFKQRKTEIFEVRDFINSKVPADIYIDIEFEDRNLGIFHIKKDGEYYSNRDLNIDSKKTDSLLTVISWTETDLEKLKEKLDKANCISVASGNPIRIGWQRSGMGMFFYDIFNHNLNDSLISQYNDGCTYIYYEENVVLEYGGGAIGPQCFPGYEREK